MVNLRWCLIAAFLLTACDGLTTDTERRRPVETDTREDASDTGAPRDTDDDDDTGDATDTGAADTGVRALCLGGSTRSWSGAWLGPQGQPPERFAAQPRRFSSSTSRSRWSPWISIAPFRTFPPQPQRFLS